MTIYIAEAHASDEWSLGTTPAGANAGVNKKWDVALPRNMKDRLEVAQAWVKSLHPQTPYAVDLMDDNSRLAYGAWPERLVVIEDGVVQYYGGQGPWEYKPKEVADWLSHRFNGAPIKVWPLSRL